MYDSYADIFSERAELYHRAMASYPLARRAEFTAVISPLQGSKDFSVCDLPSGGGYLAAHVPGTWRYTAVEPTEAFASLCRLQNRQQVVVCPLTAVSQPDALFDGVISLAGLHHEHDKLPIISEIARVLRPHGKAVIADVAQGSKEDGFLNGFVDVNSRLGHRGEFLDRNFAAIVEQSGLRICSDELVSTPWCFDSRSDAGRFATDLFGISSPLKEVTNALDTTIGFKRTKGGVELRWGLRRLVCTRLP